MEKIKIGDLSTLNSGKFLILDIFRNLYIAEHYVDKKIIGYEVGIFTTSKGYDNKSEKIFKIKSAGEFGKNDIDKYFPKRLKNEAFKYFLNLTK